MSSLQILILFIKTIITYFYLIMQSKHSFKLVRIRHWSNGRMRLHKTNYYHCFKFSVFWNHCLTIKLNKGTNIFCDITVVGSAKNCYTSTIMSLLIALHLYLMRTDYQTWINIKLLRSLEFKNLWVMSGPNYMEAPLLLGFLPGSIEGSAHSKSHINPFSGG